jgi:hypothetical protein
MVSLQGLIGPSRSPPVGDRYEGTRSLAMALEDSLGDRRSAWSPELEARLHACPLIAVACNSNWRPTRSPGTRPGNGAGRPNCGRKVERELKGDALGAPLRCQSRVAVAGRFSRRTRSIVQRTRDSRTSGHVRANARPKVLPTTRSEPTSCDPHRQPGTSSLKSSNVPDRE